MITRIQLKQLVIDVAAAMGQGWSIESKPRDDDASYRIMVGPNGEKIALSTTGGYGAKPSQINVSGAFDYRDAHGKEFWSTPYGTTLPSIKVSASKTPVQIARDITRRFLPDYLPMFASNQAARASYAEYDRATYAGVSAVCEGLGLTVPKPGKDAYSVSLHGLKGLQDSYATADIRGGRVRLDSFDLSAEEAIAVIKLIQGMRA